MTSDHGEGLLDHGDLEHAFGKVFDANARGPLLVRVPGGTRGRRIETPVSGLDVAPTLLRLAGLPANDLAGHSLLDLGAVPPDRAVAVQGLPLATGRTETRVRLDDAEGSVIYERKAGRLLVYDRRRDEAAPAMGGALPRVARRLPGVLAWLTGGAHMVRLPPGVRRAALSPASGLRLLGAWTGRRWWRAASRSERAVTWAGAPVGTGRYLVVDSADQGAGWELTVDRGAGPERLWIEAGTGGWNPFSGPPPPVGVALPTAVTEAGRAAVLDPKTEADLKALGYLH